MGHALLASFLAFFALWNSFWCHHNTLVFNFFVLNFISFIYAGFSFRLKPVLDIFFLFPFNPNPLLTLTALSITSSPSSLLLANSMPSSAKHRDEILKYSSLNPFSIISRLYIISKVILKRVMDAVHPCQILFVTSIFFYNNDSFYLSCIFRLVVLLFQVYLIVH